MSQKALQRLETEGLVLGGTTMKRAQWEALGATVVADGKHVNIANESYGNNGKGHTYTVTVKDGVPTECTCAADAHGETPCKHRAFVAMNDLLLRTVATAADVSASATDDNGRAEA